MRGWASKRAWAAAGNGRARMGQGARSVALGRLGSAGARCWAARGGGLGSAAAGPRERGGGMRVGHASALGRGERAGPRAWEVSWAN
jgi:hypothetical protein